MPSWDDMVLVGTIARTHGLRGHVVVNPATDFVEERFRKGAPLWVRGSDRMEQLVVESSRLQGGRPVVAFAGYETVDASEPLVGQELRIPEEALHALTEGVYYHHQLVGCRVETRQGEAVGTVQRVGDGASGSLLMVEGPKGEVLIPLAADICVTIDTNARKIVVEPPEGLLDLNVARLGKRTARGRERSERERSERERSERSKRSER
jgi:16S rRNA processing protein RimM